MQARMSNPAMIVPGALDALLALGKNVFNRLNASTRQVAGEWAR